MQSNPSTDPTSSEVPGSDAAADSALKNVLADFLRTACETTLERIQNVNGMTAREVLEAGASLERVMGEARAHVDKSRAALSKAAGGEGRDGLRELARRQRNIRQHGEVVHGSATLDVAAEAAPRRQGEHAPIAGVENF